MPLCSLGFFSCLYLKPVLDILRRKKERDRLYLDTRATHKTQLAKLCEKPWVTQAAFVSTSASIFFSDWLFLFFNIRGTWKTDTPKHQCFFLSLFFNCSDSTEWNRISCPRFLGENLRFLAWSVLPIRFKSPELGSESGGTNTALRADTLKSIHHSHIYSRTYAKIYLL